MQWPQRQHGAAGSRGFHRSRNFVGLGLRIVNYEAVSLQHAVPAQRLEGPIEGVIPPAMAATLVAATIKSTACKPDAPTAVLTG